MTMIRKSWIAPRHHLVFATEEFDIEANTADGSDTAILKLTGGGNDAVSRGAVLALNGNEVASVGGYADLFAGDASGAKVRIRTGASATVRVAVDENGVVTIPNLAGTGSRAVVVDADGVLSAP